MQLSHTVLAFALFAVVFAEGSEEPTLSKLARRDEGGEGGEKKDDAAKGGDYKTAPDAKGDAKGAKAANAKKSSAAGNDISTGSQLAAVVAVAAAAGLL